MSVNIIAERPLILETTRNDPLLLNDPYLIEGRETSFQYRLLATQVF
jgi:hypothetical protein